MCMVFKKNMKDFRREIMVQFIDGLNGQADENMLIEVMTHVMRD